MTGRFKAGSIPAPYYSALAVLTKEVKALDTYWNTNFNCTQCGACVKACETKGEQWLTIFQTTNYDGDKCIYIDGVSDYVPCHHCDGFWENQTPCQKVCRNNAIEISRW